MVPSKVSPPPWRVIHGKHCFILLITRAAAGNLQQHYIAGYIKGRFPGSYPGGCRFESGPRYHFLYFYRAWALKTVACPVPVAAGMVAIRLVIPIPVRRTTGGPLCKRIKFYCDIAQSVAAADC